MGTILKTYVFLNILAAFSGPVKKSMIPCMMNDELVSPGWTRAVSIIAFLKEISSSDDSKLVIISKSSSLPARDLVRILLLSIFLGVDF